MTLFSPVSPGSHYNGPLSRVDGEAVGDRPLILTFLNLHTKRETQKPSTKHHHHCDKSFQLRNEDGKTKSESLAGVTDRSAKQPLLKHLY